MTSSTVRSAAFLPMSEFQSLLDVLVSDGRTVIGPTVDQEAVVYEEIRQLSDLPRGWTDTQSPGEYRLNQTDDPRYFGFAVGPQSWKQFLFPPRAIVGTADRISADEAWTMGTPEEAPPRLAFLGVRACELAAIAVQDKVFLEGPYVDPIYQARRKNVMIIAVNCTSAASTCFCTSMNTGPECRTGFDLSLTETADRVLIESATSEGHRLVERLPVIQPSAANVRDATEAKQQAVTQISRQLNTSDLRDLLLGNLNHPRWNETGERCLSCTNCTMVCPTCFCSTVHEVSDLDGLHIQRERQWDSCFNIDFSYMNDAVVRNSVPSRYRQWLTHKLASWHDQFDESGCVGCGRCITWCPPGIDLIEEVDAIRHTDGRGETPQGESP